MKFSAYRIYNDQGQVFGRLETISLSDLNPGEVLVRNEFSSVNYKDALGPTGKGKIQKRFPIVGGIDFAGIVAESTSKDFLPGDPVFCHGCNLGEILDGGYSEYVRVPAAILLHLPKEMSLEESMIIGTAGFTAALCLDRMLDNDQSPDKGKILITGASGGVGSIAVSIFSSLGYSVTALTAKSTAKDYLLQLGANEVLEPHEIEFGTRPLEKAIWGGAVDNVGGKTLAGILRTTHLWGNIAAVGMAENAEFHSTVMPHILRGVSLLGISSNNCPTARRNAIWQKLATVWRPKNLNGFVNKIITLDELDSAFSEIVSRKITGRILVHCKAP